MDVVIIVYMAYELLIKKKTKTNVEIYIIRFVPPRGQTIIELVVACVVEFVPTRH